MIDYKAEYQKWLHSDAITEDERAELLSIAGDDKEIESRFYGPLEFGTAGLRGTTVSYTHLPRLRPAGMPLAGPPRLHRR